LTDGPPLSELEAAAISLNELYRAYVDAGFTEQQAMQIVTTIVAASIRA
jgi:hypothetical protein